MSEYLRHNSGKQAEYTKEPDAPGTVHAEAGTVGQAQEGVNKTVDGTTGAVTKAQNTMSNFVNGDANVVDAAFAVNDAINAVQGFTTGISQAVMMPVLSKLAVFKGQAILPAGKQMDPVLGIDVHMVTIPPSPAPIPLPHPFVAIIMNPKDWVSCMINTIKNEVLNQLPEPEKQEEGGGGSKSVGDSLLAHKAQITNIVMGLAGLSASVKFGGFIPRAITGTKTKNFPHIPFGTGWHPAFAAAVSKNNGKVFLGSLFVTADGDPMAGSFHLNYDCWDIGMIDLFQSRRKSAQKSPDPKGPQAELFLPTGTVLPIPIGRPVLVNSIPTPINPLTIADRLFRAGLSKLKNASRRKNEALLKKASQSKLGQKIGCPFFTKVSKHVGTGQSHPVDVAEGYFYTDNEDFDLPGPIPLVWERTWYSYSTYKGPLGHGWHHSYDMALSVDEETQLIVVRMSDGRPVIFDMPAPGQPSFNRKEKLQLHLHADGHYFMSDAREVLYNFSEKIYRNPFNKTEVCVLQSVANRNGFAIRFQYDEDGLLTQLTDSSGRKLKIKSDDEGRITTIHAPHPDEEDETFVIASYSYDAEGDMIRHEDALKQPMLFEYDHHLMVKETWRNGLTWRFFYNGTDTKAKCIEVTGDDNLLHYKFNYDNPECTLVINSLGHQKTFFHKGGVVTKYIDPNGAAWIYRYNKFDELEWEIDPLGNQTGYTHDTYGNVVTEIQPDGLFKQREFFHPQFKFFQTEEIDERGGKWQWKYDEAGNVANIKNPVGGLTTFKYEEGLLTTITDALDNSTLVSYDAQYNRKKIIYPNSGVAQYRYNQLGQPTRITNPNGLSQTRTYDLLSRTRSIVDFDKNSIQLEYDALDNIIHYEDKKKEVWYTYKGLWKLTSRTQGGATIHFNYDTEEQLRSIINEHGLPYRFELDPAGNIIKETAFDGITKQYQLNPAGWVTRLNRPGDRYTQYEHDSAGRIKKVSYQDGSAEIYQYDKGLLKQAVNANTTVEFVRDIFGNVITEKSNNHEIHSVFDKLQRRTRLVSSLGADIALELDELDNITKMNANGWQASLQYDMLGLEVNRHMTGDVKSEWERDLLGRETQHRVINNGQKNGLSFLKRDYVWSVSNQLKKITDNKTGTTQFEYDQWDNLSKTVFNGNVEQLRNPDAVGNLFESKDRKDRKYNAGGKLIESKVAFYKYDEEGFLIEKKEKKGAVWKYEWNAAGMLQRVIRPDKEEVHFKYDALGRRIEKQYKKTITKFVWDGDKPLHEWKEFNTRDSTADELITWVFNEDSFAPAAKIKGEKRYSIVTDHLGTPVQGFNETGELIWDRELDSYGKIRMLKGDEGFCNYLYQGQSLDVEIGLTYNGFRYYDQEVGVYLSQDPIGLNSDEFNLYRYVDDPNLIVDPLGLAAYHRKNGQFGKKRGRPRKPSAHGNSVHSKRPTQHYVIHDSKGKPYHGVGDVKGKRAEQSLARLKAENPNEQFSIKSQTNYTTRKPALKAEHAGIMSTGGPKSANNYNTINSPGAKL